MGKQLQNTIAGKAHRRSRAVFYVAAVYETFLCLPVLGYTAVVTFWHLPLAFGIALHIYAWKMSERAEGPVIGSLVGLAANALGWIPYVGSLLHAAAAIINYLQMRERYGVDYAVAHGARFVTHVARGARVVTKKIRKSVHGRWQKRVEVVTGAIDRSAAFVQKKVKPFVVEESYGKIVLDDAAGEGSMPVIEQALHVVRDAAEEEKVKV